MLKLNILLFFLMYFACSSTNDAQRNSADTCQKTVGQFDEFSIDVGALTRAFVVYRPLSYSAMKDTPAILVFHGGGGNIRNFAKKTTWTKVAEKEGFLLVFLQATSRCLLRDEGADTGNYWLTKTKETLLCENENIHYDEDYVDVVISSLYANYSMDSQRLYAAGFSNGLGFILQNIIIRHPQVFAAVGGSSSLINSPYDGQGNLPVCVMIGNQDDRFTVHSGVESFDMSPASILADQTQSTAIAYLSDFLRLKRQPQVIEANKATQLDFKGKMSSPNSHLRYLLLKNVSHKFPNGNKHSNHIDAAQLLWDFFKEYQLQE